MKTASLAPSMSPAPIRRFWSRIARGGAALVLLASMTVGSAALVGCEKDSGAQDRLAKAAKAEEAEEAKAAEAAKKAAAEKMAKLKAEAEAREKAEAEARANAAAGNKETTESMAKDDDQKAIIEELKKPETFKGIAARVKGKDELKPLFMAALRHEDSNVRTQAARVIVMREWKGEDVTAAWKQALLDEADDVVRENWGYDLRLYKEPALMPAALTAFKRSKSAAALGNLGETLTELGHKEALPVIQKALAETEDTMTRVFLLSALKRLPDESSRELATRMLQDEKELVRTKARQVLAVLPGPEGEKNDDSKPE